MIFVLTLNAIYNIVIDVWELMYMDYFCGKGYLNTDKTSPEYISVNNFGYTKNIDQDLRIIRSRGRLDYQMIYVDKGYGMFLVKNKLTRVDSGNIVMIYPGEKNHYEFYKESVSDYYWIHFTGVGVKNLLEKLKLSSEVFNVGDFFEFKKAVRTMAESIGSDDFLSESMQSACIYTLLTQISQKLYAPQNQISAVIARMQNEKINSMSNSDYAKICGLGVAHFLRIFKKTTGMTPHRYMAKITVEKAIEFLNDTSMNITEIANLLGFDDSLYFSRFFKKEVGIAPSRYRTEKNL